MRGALGATRERTWVGYCLGQRPCALVTTSGATYNGSYVSGEREGHGKYCDLAGDCYEGMWRKDKRAGRGTFSSAQV